MYPIFRRIFVLVLAVCTLIPSTGFAVPSFARQTGENCVACHISFPELTPFGREFKLNGYTLGERQLLPFAAMMQISATHIAKNHDNTGTELMPRNNDLQFDVLSIFFGGKLTDHFGAFAQWTYENNSEQEVPAGPVHHHSGMDNTDIRVVDDFGLFGKTLVVGLDLNNNPTVQDLWNTTPAWGFPFNGPSLPVPGPAFAAVVDGGLAQLAAGLGAYAWYDRHLYAELSFYGNANGFFSPLSAGQSWDDVPRLDGRSNPYWRVAWNQDWGSHSLMVGTYGMQTDFFPDPAVRSGPVDRFTDVAVDAQYQFLSDPHVFSMMATYIHEDQHYMASFDPTCTASGSCLNAHDHIDTFRIKASYLYDRQYGTTLAFFNTTGSNDAVAFDTGDNPVTKPDNQGYTVEVDYDPWPWARLSMQYTGYTKWDGSSKVDNLGLKPGDRDTLFLNTWFAF
jgi:hypothetical protein